MAVGEAFQRLARAHDKAPALSRPPPQYREGQVAVILEFMNLGGLDNVLRKAPGRCIPEPILAGMAYQMLFGLGYLAFERRVHRDIKPQNILANSDGRVKVRPHPATRLPALPHPRSAPRLPRCIGAEAPLPAPHHVQVTDYGISRELSTAVLAKTFIGTFKYMSPERILHQPYGYASDIWSLGAAAGRLRTQLLASALVCPHALHAPCRPGPPRVRVGEVPVR